MKKKPISWLLLLGTVVGVAACTMETPAPEERVGVARGALDSEPVDPVTACKNDCEYFVWQPCLKGCGPGPGTTACIIACNAKQDACKDGCDGKKAAAGIAPVIDLPPGTVFEPVPVKTVPVPAPSPTILH